MDILRANSFRVISSVGKTPIQKRTGSPISWISFTSLNLPSMITPAALSCVKRVAIKPPKHAEYMPFGCWMYMIFPASAASAKCFGEFGAELSLASTILTVTASPTTESLLPYPCRLGLQIEMPSRYPPRGYFSFTSASECKYN